MNIKDYFQAQESEAPVRPSLEQFLQAAVDRREDLLLRSEAEDALASLESLEIQGKLLASLESLNSDQIAAFQTLSYGVLKSVGVDIGGHEEGDLRTTLESVSGVLTRFRAFVSNMRTAKKPVLKNKEAYRDSDKLAKEIKRTYANSQWLDKQTFVSAPINGKDISPYLSLSSGITTNPKSDVEKDIAINQAEIKNWRRELKKRGQDLKAARYLLMRGDGTDEEFQTLKRIFEKAHDPYTQHKPQKSTYLGARKVTPPSVTSRRGKPYVLSEPAFKATDRIMPLTKEQVKDCAELILLIQDILYKNFYHEILDEARDSIQMGEDVPVLNKIEERLGDGEEVDRWANLIYENFEYSVNDIDDRWYRPAAICAFDDALLDIALSLAKWIDRSIE